MKSDVTNAEIHAAMSAPPPPLEPAQMMDPAQYARAEAQMRKKMRRQLVIGAIIGALGVAATIMAIVGQSFSYRSAHALERIGDQIEALSRQRCGAAPAPMSDAPR